MNRPAASPRPTWPVPVLIGVIAALAIVFIVVMYSSDDSADGLSAAQSEETAPAVRDEWPTDAESGSAGGDGPGAGTDGSADQTGPPSTVDRGEAPDMSVVERRDESDPLAIGPVDAPVALVVFSDYQCPYCAKWSDETLPELQPYIDAGDLRLEWRDVNIFGPASERGARAVYAAALQGEFQAMHNALFADGMARSETELSDERLSALAADLGLDGDQFDADYISEETLAEVGRNQYLGLELGAFTTPAFIFAGEPIVGAQPTEVFTSAMDQALSAAQGEG